MASIFERFFGKKQQTLTPAEILPQQRLPITPVEPLIVTPPLPLQPKEEPVNPFQQEAEKLVKELSEAEGKKAFVLCVDDNAGKLNDAKKLLRNTGAERNVTFAAAFIKDGAQALSFYGAFRREEALSGQTNTVIVLMDGQLSTAFPLVMNPYDTGLKVAAALNDLSQTNKWSLPLYVGNSGYTPLNKQLQAAHPEQYIGERYHMTEVFDTIDIILPSNPPPPQLN